MRDTPFQVHGVEPRLPNGLTPRARVTALPVHDHVRRPAQSADLRHARDVPSVPLHAELEVLVGIETLGVHDKLRHGFPREVPKPSSVIMLPEHPPPPGAPGAGDSASTSRRTFCATWTSAGTIRSGSRRSTGGSCSWSGSRPDGPSLQGLPARGTRKTSREGPLTTRCVRTGPARPQP